MEGSRIGWTGSRAASRAATAHKAASVSVSLRSMAEMTVTVIRWRLEIVSTDFAQVRTFTPL